MKRYAFLFILLLMNTLSYANIGRHNLQINVGGGYHKIYTPQSTTLSGSWWNPEFTILPEVLVGGGMFSVELGYLLHSVRQNNIVHGFDLRANFTMSFLRGTYADYYNQASNKMYGGIAMTYTLGRQLKSGRLMFDIIGYGIIYGVTDTTLKISSESASVSANNFGMQYILPGMQFMMNNGFTIGWRNKFEYNIFGQRHSGTFGINTLLSLGFTFGSGKQPWEN